MGSHPGSRQSGENHRGDQWQPRTEGKAGKRESSRLDQMLKAHHRGRGGLKPQPFGEGLGQDHGVERAGGAKDHGQESGDGSRYSKARQPDRGESGKTHPGYHQDEAAKCGLEHRIGQGPYHVAAGPGPRNGANKKGRQAEPGDMAAQQRGATDIGAQLHHAMDGNDGRDRHQVSHQCKQGHAAANADRDGQRGGEETGGDEDSRRPGIKPRRQQDRYQ